MILLFKYKVNELELWGGHGGLSGLSGLTGLTGLGGFTNISLSLNGLEKWTQLFIQST